MDEKLKQLLKRSRLIVILLFLSFKCQQQNIQKEKKDDRVKNLTLEKLKIETYVKDTFVIIVPSNITTGYEYCWVNESESLSISLIGKKYLDKSGCEGCNGTEEFRFMGNSKGKFNIKLAQCPTYKDKKKCSDYNSKNINSKIINYSITLR